jgi:predicted dehydrogenase
VPILGAKRTPSDTSQLVLLALPILTFPPPGGKAIRDYPPILKATELLDADTIGEPSLVRIHSERVDDIAKLALEFDPDVSSWRQDPARNPGGLPSDDGVHKYAVAMKWIRAIDKIQAHMGNGYAR